MSKPQPPPQQQQQQLPALFYSIGSPTTSISKTQLRDTVGNFLESLGARDDVLLLPPDFTRFHSQAGAITQFISEYYNFTEREEDDTSSRVTTTSASSPSIQIIPALGTHAPMKQEQIELMFGSNLANKKIYNGNDENSSSSCSSSPFVVHNWRDDVVTIGYAPETMVEKATHGMVKEKWPAQLNKLVWEKRIKRNNDSSPQPLVISIGQVVPHEVTGMANYNKNLFVGVGGVEAINLSHFIGAVHGMEKLMGRGSNPLREILNYSSSKYLEQELDLWYILTVMGPSSSPKSGNDDDDHGDDVEMKGLFIGRDVACYDLACDLSLQVNFNLLETSPKKVVVYLNEEYHSTWLGNKSIYRTRMAIDDGGELIVLAPWVETFGEDECIDALIRKVGYVGTPNIMKAMENDDELKRNLSAVAHLIHGSSEGRFSVTYCPGKLTKEEIESVGYNYADLEEMRRVYSIETLKEGWNTIRIDENGIEEEFYYISNPALGLWAHPSRFEEESHSTNATTNGDVTISSNQEASDGSGGVGGWKTPPRESA